MAPAELISAGLGTAAKIRMVDSDECCALLFGGLRLSSRNANADLPECGGLRYKVVLNRVSHARN